jgi:hypothetical protein
MGHPITDLSAASDKAMASGLRKGIEARVPGVADVNSQTQDLLGLQRSLEDALRRNVSGVGGPRTILGDFMPNVSSRGAILANQIGQSTLIPQALKAALIAALGGGQ